ncbi:MAG: efflux RND transporter permease subunit [Deltaproteobacteria bacterium]|nr:efflux RND transporter permease subunit [Deltaproteobacteria bacterium]
MKLIEFCVRYPVTVMVGVLLALLFGTIALFRLPVQMIPTVDRPEITVGTEYRGAAPLEVEREITDRLEEKLNAVESLREITSTSIEGKSTIVLKFDWGTNKDIARLGVSEKLDLVTDLPPDAEKSQIRAVNTDEESPISWIIVETLRNLNEVWEEVEDVIVPRIERVSGVGAVWRFGGQDREVHVILDPKAMAARGVMIREVREAILRENRNIKGGDLSEGKRRHMVRTLGQFTDIAQIGGVIIRHDRNRPVYIRDIAGVQFGHEDQDFIVRINGRPAIGLGVLRRSGANTVEVMKGLKAEMAYLNDKLYQDRGIHLNMVYDETEYINDSVSLVTNNIYYAVALAVIVLLLFLRSVSSILVVAIAIPVSVVTTFVFLNGLGRTLNIVTLAGLAFATGMVVDSAVVVLENIFRHREMGKSPSQSALDGAREVWGAILASTLTTVAVFVPVLFVQQEAGQLFRDIAIAISVAVLLSLVVALTVVPMLSARILSLSGRTRFRWIQAPLDSLDRSGSAFVSAIVGMLAWLSQGTLRRLAVVAGIVLGSLALAYGFAPPLDYLPQGNRNLLFVIVKTPPGFSVGQKEQIIRTLESRFLTIPELDRLFAVVRIDNPIMGAIVKREHADLEGMRKVMAEMRRRSMGIPGAKKILITQSPLFRQRGRFLGGTNIELDIKGDDLEVIRRIAEEIEEQIVRLKAVNFVNSSFEWGNPEIQVVVDRERVAAVGLSVSEVGELLETMVQGTLAGVYREGGKELDIVLKGPGREVAWTQDLSRLVLTSRLGQLVQLSDIVEIRPGSGPTKVEHVDLDRAIKLTANIREEVPLEEAVKLVEETVVRKTRQALPLGYSIDVSGQARSLVEAWDAFKWSFLLALVVIYLLMCSLFESWSLPFIIMFSVPLAATGGILAVSLAHATEPTIKMDSVTMLGFIILSGIVVNNAILIVHQALNFMREEQSPQEALLLSVKSRIRPIFMTSATTILAMLPLVLSRGAGSELYRGLGSAVLGGLALSTLFTLILIPTLYSLWLDVRAPAVQRVSQLIPTEDPKHTVAPEIAERE